MNNKSYNMDCMDYMRDLPDNAFDLAVVDPPYGIKRFNKVNKGDYVHNSSDKEKNWNNKKPTDQYFIELFRVSNYQIIWGANNFTLPESEYFIVWDKKQYYPNFASAEIAYTNIKKPSKIFTYCFSRQHGKKIMPAQKPVALYKWILQNYAKPGDKILDTHEGSGSLKIACHDMGFYYCGTELDTDYFRDSQERYKRHIAQGDLFQKKEIQVLTYNQGGLYGQS